MAGSFHFHHMRYRPVAQVQAIEVEGAPEVPKLLPFTTQTNFKLTKVKGAKDLAMEEMNGRISKLAKGTSDQVVELKDVKFVLDPVFPNGIGAVIKKKRYGFTNWALSQMGTRLGGIQASFLRKLSHHHSKDATDLLVHSLRVLRDMNAEKEVQFRTIDVPQMDGQDGMEGNLIRAVMTPGFKAVDNATILESIEKVLPDTWGTSDFSVNYEGMTARFVDRSAKVVEGMKNRNKSGLFAGFSLQNSEVGKRSISMSAFLWRLICSNGMCMPTSVYSFNRKHTGDAADDFVTEINKLIVKLPTLQEQMQSAVTEAQKMTLTPKRTARMLNAALDDSQAARPLIKVYQGREHAFTRLQQQVAHEAVGTLGKDTVWGVSNALTRTAQRLSIEPRYRLEAYAAHLLLDGVE